MSKRYVIFSAAAVLAISLAVPAFGGPSNPVAETFASAKKTAKKALKTAKKANKKAKTANKNAKAASAAAESAQGAANGAQTTADQALSDAAAAKSAADNAQTSADAAQASADAAQATADSKYGDTSFVSGTVSPTDSSASKLVSAGCGSGADPTGGGYVIGGAANNDVTVTLNQQYLSGWLVQAQEIGGGTAGTWNVTANVVCIRP